MELVLPKGRRLGPNVALSACTRGCLGVVHWCAFSHRVDTAPPPPFPAWQGQRRTDKFLLASSPCKSPAAVRLATHLRSHYSSMDER
jgi:hypothetical protein